MSTSFSLKSSLFIAFCLNVNAAFAQFDGAAGTPNSRAIGQDSSVFVAWAIGCSLERGFLDIAQPQLGRVTSGDSTSALGKAGIKGVVSLGDGGSAILTFAQPITNGNGADFAVFENSFLDTFLELARVAVSSNGIDFATFPTVCNLPYSRQIGPFDYNSDPTRLYNLAGKYRARFGTPFDLAELANIANIDISAITHVKITDVVGSIEAQYATFDKNGNPINDPYPTPFETGGFDLDAVGVIHQKEKHETKFALRAYPNPIENNLIIELDSSLQNLVLYDTKGVLIEQLPVQSQTYNTNHLPKGVYLLAATAFDGSRLVQKIIKI